MQNKIDANNEKIIANLRIQIDALECMCRIKDQWIDNANVKLDLYKSYFKNMKELLLDICNKTGNSNYPIPCGFNDLLIGINKITQALEKEEK